MNHPTNCNVCARPAPRRAAMALGGALAAGLFAGSASAQVAVIDETAVTSQHADSLASYTKQGWQWLKQLDQYKTEVDQYTQMLSKFEGLKTGLSLTASPLQPIADADSLIQAKCAGAAGGGIVGSIMNSLTSLLSQPLSDSQQQVCAQIVTTQVDKYNKTVAMLNRLNAYGGMFQGIEETMSKISTLADSGRASDQAQHYSNALTTEMANWESDMRADDAIIKTLSDQQALLAHLALNGGSTSVLGDALPDDTFHSAIGGVE